MTKISVQVEVIKDMPWSQINQYIDNTVYNIARKTLDYTAPHIPRLSGDMERAIAGYGVRGSGREYTLGDNITNYSKIVWNYPQKGTNWTNPNSYSEWFMQGFKRYENQIVSSAINETKKGLIWFGKL